MARNVYLNSLFDLHETLHFFSHSGIVCQAVVTQKGD